MAPLASKSFVDSTAEVIYQSLRHGFCCCCEKNGENDERKGTDDPSPKKKKVQVYVLLGQSNMVGMGHVKGPDQDGTLEHAVWSKGLYPYLAHGEDETSKEWATRSHVRYAHVQGNGSDDTGHELYNDWMSVNGCKTIGPEFGIVQELVNHDPEQPILIIKSCIGNRALGWDLLPPGSKQFEFTDKKGVTWVYPGYKESPDRWVKGTEPKPEKHGWYAGIQYEGDVARAQYILNNISDYYPDADEYNLAGFFFWQGDRDSRSDALSERYELNLAQFIRQLRVDFDAPKAYFCCASLGQTKIDDTNNGGKILMAELRVEKYPEFEGNAASVYSHPHSKGGSSGSHYNGNAETYMNVGQAMGKAMANLQRLGD